MYSLRFVRSHLSARVWVGHMLRYVRRAVLDLRSRVGVVGTSTRPGSALRRFLFLDVLNLEMCERGVSSAEETCMFSYRGTPP